MDYLSSDGEELDDEMLILCSDLKIQVPMKKQKILPVTLTDLENIDINNLPIEIVSEPPSPPLLDLLSPQNIQDAIPLSPSEQVTIIHLQPSEELQPLPSPVAISPPLEATKPPENDIEGTFLPSAPSTLEQLPSDSEMEHINSNRKRKSKGFAQPKKWNKNTTKLKRMLGEEYVGYRRDRKVTGQEKFQVLHDVQRPARSIGSRCTSLFCSKSKLRGCSSLSDIERENIFGKFWKSMTWEQRKQYVVSHVSVCEKKQIKVKSNSRRSGSKQYFLSTSEGRTQVCLKTFLNTLGLKESTIRCWVDRSEHGIAETTPRPNDNNDERVIKKEDMTFLKQFFASLPKMPSHYCRASTSKQYLEPIVENKNCLFRLYIQECEKESKSPLSRWTMCRVFDELNLSLFSPKKDQCDTCCSYKKKCMPIILYSDGCTAQNRNVYLSNALLQLSMEKNIIIEQKFLEKGHTQMECDAVHSSIEQKLKNQEIFLPSQFATLSKQARPQKPYLVEYLDYSFFDDFSDKNSFMYDSIRPGRSVNDPTVTDIRALQYNPSGVIKYKLNFEEDYQDLPRRIRRRVVMPETLPPRPKLYQSRIKISVTKWKHLQELKTVIPSDCHGYYDSLPY
ncbi:hypothetical protein HF086_009487 [Spodoptera exigua]|uniref:Uncharacterized protein n=1 Tax=Spodoptera exigua TaxID=7107 RepID=A0A922SED1_SPOEX|nr:hypothetical protein HF086_009487 [Spodoptera exigua]